MADITVIGQAAQQLRPLENSNIGAIVEENIRYWNSVDRKEDAAKKAAAAREAQFKYKKEFDYNKRRDDYFANTPIVESDGYQNSLVAKAHNFVTEEYVNNFKIIESGTEEEKTAARIRNNSNLQYLMEMSKTNDATAAKGVELQDKSPVDAVDFQDTHLKNIYQTGSYDIDPQNGNYIFDDYFGEKIQLTPSEFNGAVRGITYTESVNFTELGTEILLSISEPDNNGRIKASPANIEAARDRARGWVQNPIYARILADELSFKEYDKDRKAYETFDDDDFEELALKASNIYIESGFKDERDEGKSLRNALDRKKLNEEEIVVNAQISTDGTVPNKVDINGKIYSLKEGELAFVPKENAKKVSLSIDGEDAVYAAHSVQPDGTIRVFGVISRTEQVPVLNTDGKQVVEQKRIFDLDENNQPIPTGEFDGKNPIFKSSFQEVPKTEEKIIEEVIETQNQTTLTSLFGTINNATGGKSTNPTETAKSYQKKRNETFGDRNNQQKKFN
jgi:hypothetical protein